MNTILLWMWVADVCTSIGSVAIAILIAAIIATFVGCMAMAIEGWRPKPKDFRHPLTYGLLAIVVVAVFLPSKQTIYAGIAMSAAQQISETKIAGKALEAIEASLNKIIEYAKDGKK